MNALLDNEWNAYLEREDDILAAKEERNAKAAGLPTKKRAPRMSEEELAADAAPLRRRPCRRMPKPHPIMLTMTMPRRCRCRHRRRQIVFVAKASAGKPAEAFSFERYGAVC